MASRTSEAKTCPVHPVRAARPAWRVAGYGFFAVGLAGTVLPLVPTVGLWLLAVWCLAKSDDPLARKLLDHPRYGRHLRDWFDHGAICWQGKVAAVATMAISFGILVAAPRVDGWLLAGIGTVLALVSVWLVSRPAPRRG